MSGSTIADEVARLATTETEALLPPAVTFNVAPAMAELACLHRPLFVFPIWASLFSAGFLSHFFFSSSALRIVDRSHLPKNCCHLEGLGDSPCTTFSDAGHAEDSRFGPKLWTKSSSNDQSIALVLFLERRIKMSLCHLRISHTAES